MITIRFLSGAVAGFDQPTICHSGKPKRNRCHAVSREPGREGWFFVQNPSSQRRRDGWWCPDCARQLQEQLGSPIRHEIIPIVPEGRA
jgi:hypothetical protein